MRRPAPMNFKARYLVITILCLISVTTGTFVFAADFAEPTQNPPSNNTNGPIWNQNTATRQSASFYIDGQGTATFFEAGTPTNEYGNVQIGDAYVGSVHRPGIWFEKSTGGYDTYPNLYRYQTGSGGTLNSLILQNDVAGSDIILGASGTTGLIRTRGKLYAEQGLCLGGTGAENCKISWSADGFVRLQTANFTPDNGKVFITGLPWVSDSNTYNSRVQLNDYQGSNGTVGVVSGYFESSFNGAAKSSINLGYLTTSESDAIYLGDSAGNTVKLGTQDAAGKFNATVIPGSTNDTTATGLQIIQNQWHYGTLTGKVGTNLVTPLFNASAIQTGISSGHFNLYSPGSETVPSTQVDLASVNIADVDRPNDVTIIGGKFATSLTVNSTILKAITWLAQETEAGPIAAMYELKSNGIAQNTVWLSSILGAAGFVGSTYFDGTLNVQNNIFLGRSFGGTLANDPYIYVPQNLNIKLDSDNTTTAEFRIKESLGKDVFKVDENGDATIGRNLTMIQGTITPYSLAIGDFHNSSGSSEGGIIADSWGMAMQRGNNWISASFLTGGGEENNTPGAVAASFVGNVKVSGGIYTNTAIDGLGVVAVPVSPVSSVGVGNVVIWNGSEYRLPGSAGDKLVVGVVTDSPSLAVSAKRTGSKYLATSGIVKVYATSGVYVGDLLMASAANSGRVTRCLMDCMGRIVGKALETTGSSNGYIKMIVSLE